MGTRGRIRLRFQLANITSPTPMVHETAVHADVDVPVDGDKILAVRDIVHAAMARPVSRQVAFSSSHGMMFVLSSSSTT